VARAGRLPTVARTPSPSRSEGDYRPFKLMFRVTRMPAGPPSRSAVLRLGRAEIEQGARGWISESESAPPSTHARLNRARGQISRGTRSKDARRDLCTASVLRCPDSAVRRLMEPLSRPSRAQGPVGLQQLQQQRA
jgi:hypothetical protein